MRQTLKIYKSNMAIEAQLIDAGKTLIGRKYYFKDKSEPSKQAFTHGEDFGKSLIENKVSKITFDRNGSRYHGSVKSFAEGLRKSGINF
ncbi:MAG: 50S ribosomal protein L18 [bacterium]